MWLERDRKEFSDALEAIGCFIVRFEEVQVGCKAYRWMVGSHDGSFYSQFRERAKRLEGTFEVDCWATADIMKLIEERLNYETTR